MATALTLDEIDEQILDSLERDGRRPLADLATEVNLSTSAVKRRVDRLERVGVITGYSAIIDYGKLGRRLEAFAELRFTGNASVDEIRQAVADIPEAHALFTITGDFDAMVWLQVEDVDSLRRAIDALRRNRRVVGTKTMMVLQSWWRREAQLPSATTADRRRNRR